MLMQTRPFILIVVDILIFKIMEKQEVKDLCKSCAHYWVDFPLPLEQCVGHCEISDVKNGFGKMDEVVPYPCVECPFNAYKKK